MISHRDGVHACDPEQGKDAMTSLRQEEVQKEGVGKGRGKERLKKKKGNVRKIRGVEVIILKKPFYLIVGNRK